MLVHLKREVHAFLDEVGVSNCDEEKVGCGCVIRCLQTMK